MDRVQHDDRYLAFCLELVIGVRRPKFERLFPKSEAFLARRCPGPRFQLPGPNLHVDIRIGYDIAVPSRVLGRATLRRDNDVTAAVRSVKQWEYELIARFAAGGGQQQRRRCDLTPPRNCYFMHVPVGSAAREIAV